MTVGEYLKNYKKANRISYAEIGRRCGLSKQMVSKLVNGQIKKTSSDTVAKIAQGTGVALSDLIKILDLEIIPQSGGETLAAIRQQREQITDEMYTLYTAYRRSSPETQKAIRLLLGIEEDHAGI